MESLAPLIVQDVIAGAIAAGAAVLLVRRVIGVIRPADRSPACPTCTSGCPVPAADLSERVEPLRLHRKTR